MSLLRCFYTCSSIPWDGNTCTRERVLVQKVLLKTRFSQNNWAFNCLLDSLNSFLVYKILLFSVALKENLSAKTVVCGLFMIPPLSTPEFEPGSELHTS